MDEKAQKEALKELNKSLEVYKGKFGKNIYSYIKDTDYYRVLFKYKDGSKTYNIEYNFFTNVLQPEVL